MTTRRIWELIGRKLSGEASAAELQELEQLLQSHPELHSPANTLTDIWQKTLPPQQEDNAAAAHERHILRMQEKGIPIGDMNKEVPGKLVAIKGPLRRYLWAAAAVAGIIVTISLWRAVTVRKAVPAALSEVATRNGSRTSLVLPDGTRVWLNGGSKLIYDKQFSNGNRAVTLIGEAFFDVVKQASHPFVIHTATMDIRVLGTRFNVRSYPDDKTTEAALISGSIEAIPKNRTVASVILKPNEKIVVLNEVAAIPTAARNANTATAVIIQPVSHYAAKENAITETSWLDHKLVFKDESFAELAQHMERFYGVTIHFTDKQKEELRFTGIFAHETVQQALNALKMTAAFHYSMHDNDITIN
ncbi:FecR family protein [Chitinophaga niastensis]|uniref:FecR family protein n=1 Tax=Chitinophaga niastensis TaxID=536980 RepID=A0A2P8HP82_CHINA|nr:FecR family protein [Chitinophaga niastensis]PSL48015.1 FecR family protein [Chitinophaga niastensis]